MVSGVIFLVVRLILVFDFNNNLIVLMFFCLYIIIRGVLLFVFILMLDFVFINVFNIFFSSFILNVLNIL